MRILPSSSRYPFFNFLWSMNAILTNIHMHTMERYMLPEAEMAALKRELYEAMERLMDEVPVEFINFFAEMDL